MLFRSDDLEEPEADAPKMQPTGMAGMAGNIKKLGNLGGAQVYGVGPGGATIGI